MKALRRLASGNWELAVLIALAALIYRPWSARALPILDFSEFLPQLRAHDTIVDQFGAIARYMRTQGRFCPLLYAYIVSAWNAFGMWAPGWHWSYFLLNSAVIVTGRRLFLRIGAGRAAAIAALAVWAVMPPVAAAWLRPTGEPIGLLLIIAALMVAHNYCDADDWKSRALTIAALCIGIIAAKEMLVIVLPVIWLMTRLRHDDKGWSWARWSRRDAVAAAEAAVASILALAPVALVAMSASPDSYARRYGSVKFTVDNLISRAKTVVLPSGAGLPKISAWMNDPGWQSWLAFPNIVWIALLVGSVLVLTARRRRGAAGGMRWPMLVAFTWAAAGAIAYVPWPSQATFYMLPFAFGVAFGAALLLTSMSAAKVTSFAASIAVLLVLTISSVEARDLVRQHELRVKTDQEIIASIARTGKDLPIYAAVPQPAPDTKFGWGRELAEYGRAAGLIDPETAGDISCNEARIRAALHSPVVIVSAVQGCGAIRGGSLVVQEAVPLRRWPWLLAPRRIVRTAFVVRSGEELVSTSEK